MYMLREIIRNSRHVSLNGRELVASSMLNFTHECSFKYNTILSTSKKIFIVVSKTKNKKKR